MIRCLSSLFCILICSVVHSQTGKIAGKITSSENDDALDFVAVNLKSPDTIITCITNDSGLFSFDNLKAGLYDLKVANLGFRSSMRTITIKPIDSLWIPIRLSPDTGRIICSECAIRGYNVSLANEHIAKGAPRILLRMGTAADKKAMLSPKFPGSKRFERKYRLQYFNVGNCDSEPENGFTGYNQTIFNYLDRAYGTRWRAEVDKRAIGIR